MNQDIFQMKKMRQTLSRSFNGVLEGSKVSYLSNALLVVESVIMLSDVLIKINMKKGIGKKL